MTGFPFAGGMGSFSDEGALDPISGVGEVVTAFGEYQELSSCWNVILNIAIQNVECVCIWFEDKRERKSSCVIILKCLCDVSLENVGKLDDKRAYRCG